MNYPFISEISELYNLIFISKYIQYTIKKSDIKFLKIVKSAILCISYLWLFLFTVNISLKQVIIYFYFKYIIFKGINYILIRSFFYNDMVSTAYLCVKTLDNYLCRLYKWVQLCLLYPCQEIKILSLYTQYTDYSTRYPNILSNYKLLYT